MRSTAGARPPGVTDGGRPLRPWRPLTSDADRSDAMATARRGRKPLFGQDCGLSGRYCPRAVAIAVDRSPSAHRTVGIGPPNGCRRPLRPDVNRWRLGCLTHQSIACTAPGEKALAAISSVGYPAPSSRPRSLAASIADSTAARTPCRSNSRIALIVVPPGEVTASRSRTGCSPESRSIVAAP